LCRFYDSLVELDGLLLRGHTQVFLEHTRTFLVLAAGDLSPGLQGQLPLGIVLHPTVFLAPVVIGGEVTQCVQRLARDISR
jgi:hypothetical protein